MRIQRLITLGVTTAVMVMPMAARACDACMGAKDPTIRPAVNGAIFFMLGTVGMMATGVGFFMRYLAKRAKMPLPPHAEFNGL